MLKYLFYLFVILVGYSILAYVYTNKAGAASAPPVKKVPTTEAFAADDDASELIKELSTMANRLTVISGKLATKSRAQPASSKDGHEDAPKKEEKKTSETFAEDADHADAKKDAAGSEKKDGSGDKDKDKKKKDEGAALIKSMRDVMEAPDSKDDKESEKEKEKVKERESFSNYEGVESVKFSNYMLL